MLSENMEFGRACSIHQLVEPPIGPATDKSDNNTLVLMIVSAKFVFASDQPFVFAANEPSNERAPY